MRICNLSTREAEAEGLLRVRAYIGCSRLEGQLGLHSKHVSKKKTDRNREKRRKEEREGGWEGGRKDSF